MKMNDLYRTLLVLCVLAGIGWAAWTTAPKTDNCTPTQIARYTNIIISYQDCEVKSNCLITPRDVERFHDNQISLATCVTKIAEGLE